MSDLEKPLCTVSRSWIFCADVLLYIFVSLQEDDGMSKLVEQFNIVKNVKNSFHSWSISSRLFLSLTTNDKPGNKAIFYLYQQLKRNQ